MDHFEIIKNNSDLLVEDKRIKKTIDDLGLKLANRSDVEAPNIERQEKGVEANGPEFFNNQFEKEGFKIVQPMNIVDKKIKTLFVVSGVQILDPIIHDNAEIVDQKIFIAQPVIRTQFLPQVQEGSLTSFVNLTANSVNKSYEEHVGTINKWLLILENLGFSREKFSAQVSRNKNLWDRRRFENDFMGIYYNSIEIGEASYIEKMPQDNRPPISISDVGFGVERMNFSLCGKTFDDYYKKELPIKIIDSSRTLALLAGSGAKPGNNGQGYRVRLFSKNFVRENMNVGAKAADIFKLAYKQWSRWTKLPLSMQETLDILLPEYDRNFNREILDFLHVNQVKIELDINQSTDDFVIQLIKTGSVDKKLIDNIYKLYAK